MTVSAASEGFHRVTPYLLVTQPETVIKFAMQAFSAVEEHRSTRPDGSVLDAQLKIGDSILKVSRVDSAAAMPASLYVYVNDADAVYSRALQAGAEPVCELEDTPQGDRRGSVRDRCGNQWWIATCQEIVPPDEQMRRQDALASSEASSGDASEIPE